MGSTPVAELEDPIIGFSSLYTWVQSSNLEQLSSDYKGVSKISLGSFEPNSYVLALPLVGPDGYLLWPVLRLAHVRMVWVSMGLDRIKEVFLP